MAEQVNAKKEKLGREEALKMAREADELYAAKGKKIDHLDLKNESHEDDAIVKLMIGPTGNLRAPAFRIGRTLLIGFNNELYTKLLG